MRKNERKTMLLTFRRQKAVIPLLACVLACSPMGMYAYGQNDTDISISINKKGISVKEALDLLKEQSGVFLMYREEAVKGLKVDLDLNGASLTEALDKLCAETGLTYEFSNGHVLIYSNEKLKSNPLQEKKILLHGVVTDDQGLALEL